MVCRPKLKEQMEYCMAHPEELTKVAAVQKRVRQPCCARKSMKGNRTAGGGCQSS